MIHGSDKRNGAVPLNLTTATGGDNRIGAVPLNLTTSTGGGLIISKTETISSFLSAASTDPHLTQELRDLSSSLSQQPSVPYKPLRSIWIASDPSTRLDLFSLLFGSNFILTSPKPREKSEELKARLRKLEEASERKAYEELVKDITHRKGAVEPFSSYKDQLGFGLHVALTMFTGYLVGYAAFRALFGRSPAMSAAGGILGLVGGMLVETLLFIIRASSNQDLRSIAPTSKPKKDQYYQDLRSIPSISKLKKDQ